jgi:zinc transporter ZupT
VLTGRFFAVFAASLISCAITTLGIHVIKRHEKWARANTPYFISFAAGMLISVTFLHLIPKACSMSQAPYGFFLGGFMGFYASKIPTGIRRMKMRKQTGAVIDIIGW